MATKIGSAAVDERGKYSGGKAGDQTGKEVRIKDFYVHSKGWVVLRAKDITVAEKLAKAMTIACNNENIGYDQGNRLGAFNHGVETTVKTEADCSGLVRACIKYAGYEVGNFTTATERTVLLATGLFDAFDFVSESKTPLYEGDILVTKTKGHTEIVVSGNKRTAGSASSNEYEVKVTASALNIRKGPGTSYGKVGIIRDKGTYTIVEEKNGWGLLKGYQSGRNGWISLKYTKKK